MTDWFFRGDFGSAPTNIPVLMVGLLLSFLGGQLIAWVYMFTHSGLSYSRAFVNSLVMMPIVVTFVMMVMSNNLVTAFGLMAIFAIVRFRNILRDTLDTTYVLTVIVVGIGCGTMKFSTAIVGCLTSCLVFLYLWYTSFGSRHRYDIILNLHWARPATEMPALSSVLTRHSRNTHCASHRSAPGQEGTDLSYRVLLRDPDRMDDLLSELKSLPGVSRVSGLKAEDESEI